jgi:hypothetical protein
MSVGDVTLINIRNYVRMFYIIDECTRPEGCVHVAPYIRRSTDESIGPGVGPQQPRDPYMRQLTNEFNSYIYRLTDEFS